MDTKVRDIVIDALRVPSLIGDGQPFATFSSFARTFFNATKQNEGKTNTKLASLKNLFDNNQEQMEENK